MFWQVFKQTIPGDLKIYDHYRGQKQLNDTVVWKFSTEYNENQPIYHPILLFSYSLLKP